MISTILIENYRAIRKLNIEGLKQVNIIVGPNNSGKSSFLEAIYLASAFVDPEDKIFPVSLEIPGRGRNKLIYLLSRRGEAPFSASVESIWKSEMKRILWFNYDTSNPIKIALKINNVVVQVNISAEKLYPAGVLEIKKPQSEFLSKVTFIDNSTLRMLKHLEDKLWFNILLSDLDKDIISLLKGGYNVDAEYVTFMPVMGQYRLIVKLKKGAVRVNDLGDGARYAILLAMVLSSLKDTALLLEEPETHQHPAGLAETLKIMYMLAKMRNIQIFITTHSIELVRIASRIAEEKEIPLAIYFFERKMDGEIDVRKVTPEDKDILEKLGIDIRFLHLF